MLHRGVGGLAAGGLPADAVDDHEEAAREVDVEPVLVDLALQSRVGVAGRSQRRDRHGHFPRRPSARLVPEGRSGPSARSAW